MAFLVPSSTLIYLYAEGPLRIAASQDRTQLEQVLIGSACVINGPIEPERPIETSLRLKIRPERQH